MGLFFSAMHLGMIKELVLLCDEINHDYEAYFAPSSLSLLYIYYL